VMIVTIVLCHGLGPQSLAAIIGTTVSLGITIALAALFIDLTNVSGVSSEESQLVLAGRTDLSLDGLILAGMIIGALGVLDDVTVTQTSAVWELRRANPALGPGALFSAAMRIGRDHVASAVNTLVLAYAGASLPLLLLFTVSGRALGDVVTAQDVATEVVRTLVGSIGLVASVPVTTLLAAVIAARVLDPDAASEGRHH
jgi:uncharacterized membrane protein